MPEPLRKELVTLNTSCGRATEPGERGQWNGQCLVWESARPYNYLRTGQDGRIVIGGEDVPFRSPALRNRLIPAKTKRLEERLRQLLPGLETTTAHSWAGTFGETADGLPSIGPGASGSRLRFALGYGGNGITFSVVAARILGDLVGGISNDDARIFTLERAG